MPVKNKNKKFIDKELREKVKTLEGELYRKCALDEDDREVKRKCNEPVSKI